VTTSLQNAKSRKFFGHRESSVGADIFRCQDVLTSHFLRNAFAFLFTAAFGTIVRDVENDPVRVQSIGPRRSTPIDAAISASRANCGDVAIKSSWFGNAVFAGKFLKRRLADCCDC
jgi:hypothetical protein